MAAFKLYNTPAPIYKPRVKLTRRDVIELESKNVELRGKISHLEDQLRVVDGYLRWETA